MSQAGSLSSGSGPSSPGALVLVQTQSATLVTSLPFTTGITPSFNNYLLVSNNITDPTFAGANFGLQISSDGGATYINTGYSSGNTVNITLIPLTGLEAGAGVPNVASLFSVLLNFTSGVDFVTASGFGTTFVNDVGPAITTGGGTGGYTIPNFIVNAFQLVADDGTPFSGTFSLYGLSI